jgi:hypothetical protein
VREVTAPAVFHPLPIFKRYLPHFSLPHRHLQKKQGEYGRTITSASVWVIMFNAFFFYASCTTFRVLSVALAT